MVMPATSPRGLFALLYPNFFILCAILAVVCLTARFISSRNWQRALSGITKPRWQLAFAVLLSVLYIWMGCLVLLFPGYVDPVEPMVVTASFFAVHQRPVYDMVISYGPLCFLPYGFAMELFGATLGVSKACVGIANAVFIVVLFRIFRKFLSRSSALLATAIVLSTCLMKQDYVFQTRGDLFIYVAVALALLAAMTENSIAAGCIIVAALTLACGVKITAFLYLWYPLALFERKHGIKILLTVLGVSALLSLLPFALGTLCLSDYLHWISVMSHQPKSKREFIGNLVTTALLAAPCLLAYFQLRLKERTLARQYLRTNGTALLLLVCSIAAMDLLASKIGAGRHHLGPYFVLVGAISAQLIGQATGSVLEVTRSRLLPVYLWGCLAMLLLLTELSELRDVRALTALEAPQAIALDNDVKSIFHTYKEYKLELGNGFGEFDLDRTYSPMFSAAQVVFAGGAYTFDPSAQADVAILRKPMRQSDLRHVASCESDVWLIPRGQKPFHTISIYSGMYPDTYNGQLLFPASFEQLFRETYSLASSTRFFDVYTCKNPKNVG